ncbi:hypothetical protein [Filifactor villosus]|uniref:Colicin D immunity protein domain-containing protein n=1 Tax=Filifactor villosus TaxID=29374 RepID=A0ABV9QME2_9FIRM
MAKTKIKQFLSEVLPELSKIREESSDELMHKLAAWIFWDDDLSEDADIAYEELREEFSDIDEKWVDLTEDEKEEKATYFYNAIRDYAKAQ